MLNLHHLYLVISPFIIINVGCLRYDNGRLRTAPPPGVAVNLVVFNSNVVSLVYSDSRVRTVMNLDNNKLINTN